MSKNDFDFSTVSPAAIQNAFMQLQQQATQLPPKSAPDVSNENVEYEEEEVETGKTPKKKVIPTSDIANKIKKVHKNIDNTKGKNKKAPVEFEKISLYEQDNSKIDAIHNYIMEQNKINEKLMKARNKGYVESDSMYEDEEEPPAKPSKRASRVRDDDVYKKMSQMEAALMAMMVKQSEDEKERLEKKTKKLTKVKKVKESAPKKEKHVKKEEVVENPRITMLRRALMN